MKTPSDDLFKFVKSLDAHEKAFITKSFNSEKLSINERLYNYLLSSSNYDETTLLKELSFIPKTSFKHSKQTLFELILNRLELYYSEFSPEQELNKLLFKVKLLRQKKFLPKAYKIATIGIEKTEQFGLFLLQREFNQQLQFIALEGDDIKHYEFLKKNNNITRDFLFKCYREFHNNQEIINELKKLEIIDGYYPEKIKLQNIKNIYAEILAKIKNSETKKFPQLIQSQFIFLEFYSLLLLNDYEKAKKSFKIFLSYYNSPGIVINDYEEHFFKLNKGISMCVLTHDKTFVNQIEKTADFIFETLPVKKRNINLLQNYYAIKNNIIAFITHDEDFFEAKNKAENIWDKIMSDTIRLNIQKIFLANLCQIYLCCNESKKALNSYNLIINNRDLYEIRVDINPGVNLLGLAIFYELKMIHNIESLIRYCLRQKDIKSQPFIYKEIISFFQKVIDSVNKKNEAELLNDILSKIENINLTDKESLFFLENTKIKFWLISKL